MIMKNKRADIPVTILVLGVFTICALALLSFYYSGLKVKDSFENVAIMEEMNSQIEKYNFYLDVDLSKGELKDIFDIRPDNGGRYYIYLEKNEVGLLSKWKKEKTLLEVRYYLSP